MLKRAEFILFIAVFVFTMELQALAAEKKQGEHKESHYHLHHVGLFLGSVREEGENTFTVGLDYEYRFSPYFGVGILGEYTGKNYREGVVLVPLHSLSRDKTQKRG